MGVYHECPFGADVGKRLPPHRLVVEPLISYAREIRVHGTNEQSLLYDEIVSMGTPSKHHVTIDLSQSVVRGHERIWNSGGWRRGAIVIVAAIPRQALTDVFHWCDGPSVCSSLHQVQKGTPSGAITFAQKEARDEQLCFVFSASNGIQWMDVFVPPAKVDEVFEIAEKHARPFKRFAEHNSDEDEIIIDREPYISMI